MAFISMTLRIVDQSIPIPVRYDLSTTVLQWPWSACNLPCKSPNQSGKASSLFGHSSGQSLPLSSIAAGTLCRHVGIGVYL